MSGVSAPRERHFATEKAWKWLEDGEGRERSEEDRERIAETLRRLDTELLAFDRHLELTR